MKRSWLCVLLCLILFLSGCAKIGSPEIRVSELSAKPNLIFIVSYTDNEYWKSCIQGVRAADALLGTQTRVIGPQTDESFVEDLPLYLERAIAEKPDGICIYAGLDALNPLLDEAAAQGIPVIAVDSDTTPQRRVAFVGPNDYNLGFNAGEALVELTGGQAKVGILLSSFSAKHETGILNALCDSIADYDMDIVAVRETQAIASTAKIRAREMLYTHPEMNVLFCTTNTNLTEAARVKEELGRDDVLLVGFDDTEENLHYLRNGQINLLFVQRPEQMGFQAISLMHEYLERGKLPRDAYDTGSIRVTRENVDTYSSISDNIHPHSKTVRVGYYAGSASFQAGMDKDSRKSGYAYEYYQAIANLCGWNYEYVYGSRAEMLDLLVNGGIDIVAGVYRTDALSSQLLFSEQDMGLEGERRYFAVNNRRHDLLSELDSAMEQIRTDDPAFVARLWQKYYSHSSTGNILTSRERAWLTSKGLLRMGYVKGDLPFSDQTETGKVTGLARDLCALLHSLLILDVEPTCYENVSEMEAALARGEIDAAFPSYSDLSLTESKGFRQTDSFLTDRVMLVYRGNYSDDLLDRVALNQLGVGHRNYMSIYYPASTLQLYPSREKVFEAILRGDERCTIGCFSIFQRFLSVHPQYRDLHIAYLDAPEAFCIAVRQEDSLLAGILNKAVRQWDTASITSSMMAYSSADPEYTLSMLIRQNAVLFIAILLVFLTVLVLFFAHYRRRVKLFNSKQAKTQAALEEALVEAKSASQAKTTFLSSMSHDIRTPMNAIVGMTAIAVRHLDEKERVADCLDKITLSSQHLLTLINDVLDISKIESGKLTLNPSEVSLRDLINTLLSIVRPQLQAKNMQFETHMGAMPYEMVCADEVRINQIFINILTNAIKYTPAGGKVSLSLSEEPLPDNRQVRLTYVVEDNGIGMSEEFLKNVYDTFARATDCRINKIQGTGLGLAIVKQVVDMMGGTIDCQSQLDHGTRFTVCLTLPVAAQDLDALTLPGLRVLLADDDETYLRAVSGVLTDMGAQVETVRTGEEALQRVRAILDAHEALPACIVGWNLPDREGSETASALRELMGTESLILLSSAIDRADTEDILVSCGANGFLSKSLFRSELYEKLCRAQSSEANSAAPSDHPYRDLYGRHLLIAEDNDLNWEIISELLDMYDITADRAVNGKVCVEMLTSAPKDTYDLVLMDIQMPVMNGLEAARAIRVSQLPHVRDIPIIAMTADAFTEDIANCLDAGMDSHVSKPVDMTKLCQEMQKVLPPPRKNWYNPS